MNTVKINKKKILLVEGYDEEGFIGALLTKMGIEDIEIRNAKGKTNINSALGAISLQPDFEELVSVGVIRDADADAAAAFASVLHGLSTYGYPTPEQPQALKSRGTLSASVFILPGNGEAGMLETLVWRSIVGEQVAVEVDAFLERCRAVLPPDNGEPRPDGPAGWRQPKSTDKARVLSLLATMLEPQSRMGIAAQKRYFDLGHDAFQALCDYLTVF